MADFLLMLLSVKIVQEFIGEAVFLFSKYGFLNGM